MRRSKERIVLDRMRLLGRLSRNWTPTSQLGNTDDLRWLESEGLAESRHNSRRGAKRLFFCVKCERVISRETYRQYCPPPRKGPHDLRPFYPTIRFLEWRITVAGEHTLAVLQSRAA